MIHTPVLLDRVLEGVREIEVDPKHYLDCTFGRGGHMKAILAEYPSLQVDAIDRDEEALEYAKQEFQDLLATGQLVLHHMNFMKLSEKTSVFEKKYDLILADLGVSSPQLDEADRGFSFYHEGPLDMRMDRSQKETAADIVNSWSEEELLDLFIKLGEVRQPLRVVQGILKRREEEEFKTTTELSELIASVDGWRKKGTHPATKYFLALRLQVNEEIEILENSILDLMQHLQPKGRLLVITFHSMEDRLVKWVFKNNSHLGKIITKKAIQPKWQEKKENPRARSAILRIFEKGVEE